jgi:glycerol-3-phosphate dehydrogenase
LLDVPGAASTAAVPREHRIVEDPSGLITIAGGKLTTYRSMAAEVVDHAARRLRRLDGRVVPRRAGTDAEPLPGGEVADLDLLARDLVEEGLGAGVATALWAGTGAKRRRCPTWCAATLRSGKPSSPGTRSSLRRWSTRPGARWR